MSDFDDARRAAMLSDLVAAVSRRPSELLRLDEIRESLSLSTMVDRGVVEIAVASIVGTIGRAHGFNRAFLPRTEAARQRWNRVREMFLSQAGFLPIEVYRVGEVHFVIDGHHRVSVARALGAPTIEARVREFPTAGTLRPDDSPRSVLERRALDGFMETTRLPPDSRGEFTLSSPAGYERLLDHISVHRYYLGIERGGPASWDDAVRSWVASVWRPALEAIRASAVMASFPGQTEGDLYLYVMERLHALREREDSGASAERAVRDLESAQSARRPGGSWLRRMRRPRRD
ncbi:MAG TPA: hypothetical protein VMS56_04145 [Thermoanaerobaculia bacterium]|nr:hypothetical protein [Thermoanaerobaculia bacterium]